jgi:shikimate kinase/3-dehydroquinate synthase
MTRNIVITGFMGTGKTSAGRMVAERLGRPFIDMDIEIEKILNKPIKAIFSEEGEQTFREVEKALCHDLGTQKGLVIATGGGTLLDPEMYKLMASHANLVCLNCTVDEILRRLNTNAVRPLLNVADRRAEIEKLLFQRHDAYAAVSWQIDTTNLSIEEVSRQIETVDRIRTLSVRYPQGKYPIRIAGGLLYHTGSILIMDGVPQGSRVAVVSNPIVAKYYAKIVTHSLEVMGYHPLLCIIPDGEQYKTLATVADLYEQFAAGDLDRSSTVLALGGGVTGDLAGLAAGTYMRGMRFVQVPTTLLAMVDASVGGKTGVDLPLGKNLVGVFKQPISVIIDTLVLDTLPVAELRSGMAETIKHAVIAEEELFGELEQNTNKVFWWRGRSGHAWLARSLKVKIDVVKEDPYEKDTRAVLNLGHTIGHALEKLSGYTLRHGEAVSIGLAVEAQVGSRLGLAGSALPRRIEALLEGWGLPVRCPPYPTASILEAAAFDKKKRGSRMRWALPIRIGEVRIVEDVPLDVVEDVLRQMGAGE